MPFKNATMFYLQCHGHCKHVAWTKIYVENLDLFDD